MPIQDEADARYALQCGRGLEAATWYRAQVDAHPDDARALERYLWSLPAAPDLRHDGIRAEVAAWNAAHPDEPRGVLLTAAAIGLEPLEPTGRSWGSLEPPVPWTPGPWCDELLSLPLPADPEVRFELLLFRVRADKKCERDGADDRAALVELALAGAGGPAARAGYGAGDLAPSGDVDALREALEAEPWQVRELGPAYANRADGRDLVLETARALAASDRPALVDTAISALSVAGQTEEAIAAAARVVELDPDNHSARFLLAKLQGIEGSAPVETDELLDGAARLLALQEEGRSGARDADHFRALADAARSVGDTEAQLDALWHLRDFDWDSPADLEYAQVALDHGIELKKARSAARWSAKVREDPPDADGSSADSGFAWRWRLAAALELKGRAEAALGRDAAAGRDLNRAAALVPPSGALQLALGLRSAEARQWRPALQLLVPGLARAPDDPAAADARIALQQAVSELHLWAPDLDALIASYDPAPAEPVAPPVTPDASAFDGFTAKIDGVDQVLLDLPGPLVVDVWATWCGPCRQSLPHLNELAQKHAGEVTFVALSVDTEPGKPAQYLASHGGGAFVAAFGGLGALDRLAKGSIPAVFVFDADHRLVAKLSGYRPGSTALDEAVEKMLAPR